MKRFILFLLFCVAATSLSTVLAGTLDIATASTPASGISCSIMGLLSSPVIRVLLIALIIGGLAIEFHSPGLGFPVALSIIVAVLYFLPAFMAGTLPAWVLVFFVVGLVLLALEIFVIPGFGVCGICGIAAVLVSVVGGMLDESATSTHYGSDIISAITITLVGVIIAVALVWYLTSKHGPKWVRRHSELQAEQRVSDGFIGVDMEPARYVGDEGVAVTDMRPAGKIRIGEEDFDAVSMNGFIDSGRPVKVVKFENAQLYVTVIRE